ncbi:uncharacterized protein LOC135848815 [Planococcus citri]|uniref:uncharacterized protein LOC135848815 n=1 Tax=Planococcus citri TaxID=170843 RepID=UPI0031F80CE4
MSDYEENIVIIEEQPRAEAEAVAVNDDEDAEEEEEVDDYHYSDYNDRRRYGWWLNDSGRGREQSECKKCKVEEPYEFVIISPTILTSAPRLLDIASVTVAASLWNHVNIPAAVFGVTSTCTKKSAEWAALSAKVIALVVELKLPNSLAEVIVKYVGKMSNAITAWVSYHYRTVFLKNGLDKLVYTHVYHIVWNHNGTINCAETARSMMTSLRLSEVEKLKFLCVYCLKDDMDEMSPLLYLNNVLDYVSCEENPLIYYWYRYFRNELNKVPTIKVDDDSEPSIDVYMFRNDKVDNWSAKQYFFQQLDRVEQVREAIWLIDKHGLVYQKAVMLELDEIQRLHVYTERAVQIIANYSRLRISSRLILMTWHEASHLLSPDEFLTIFQDLLKADIDDTVMKEIWTSAADDFKHHVLSFNDYEMVRKVFLEWKASIDPDFVFVLLHDCSPTVRKTISTTTFFKMYCEKLLTEHAVHGLDRLLEFCLTDAEESTQFKFNLVNSSARVRDICLEFYSTGDANGLNNFLRQLLPSYPDLVVEYKKNVLDSTHGINQCISVMDNEVDVLNAIFEDTLPNANSIAEFRRRVILSPSSVAKLTDLILKNRLEVVQICIDRFLTSDEDKNTLKQTLISLNLIQKIITDQDASYLQAVMISVFGNENAITEFKRSLSLSSIIISMLKKIIFYRYSSSSITECRFRWAFKPSDFEIIDHLLNWYFNESEIRIKAYKRKLISSYNQIEMFKITLRGSRGDSYLRSTLAWFFKDDAEEKAKFRSSVSGKIASLLY